MPQRSSPRTRARAAHARRPAHPSLPARPRRALGQHFLHDASVLSRIVREGGFHANEDVLEVGGGTGELTERLAVAVRRLVSIEIDETLARFLRGRLAPYPNVHVISTDILDHPPLDLLGEGGGRPPFAVAGNIPYAITAPLLRHFLTAEVKPTRMVLLVQREVAQRLAARPGALSLLGVSVQLYSTVRILFPVPRAAFTPPPQVESAVVRIDLLPRPAVALEDEERFFTVVRAGFRNPRKQLHNALAQGLWLPPGGAPELLRAAGIDAERRAQTLSLEEWEALARAYGLLKQDMHDSGRMG